MANKISKTANVNLVSNKVEGLSEIQQKIREQAKLEIFQTLDMDKRKFTDIGETISKLKESEKDSTKQVEIIGKKLEYDSLKTTYKSIFESYKGEKEKMYMKIAERIILDNGGVVSYREDQEKGINKDFVEKEYNSLNEDEKYHNKLDFFTVKDKEGNLYIIQWSKNEERRIKDKEKAIKDKILEDLYRENNEKQETIDELKKKLEGDENKDKKPEGENDKKNPENDKKGNKETKNNGTESSENENEKEEFLRKLKEYCPRLFEGKDKTEKSEHKEKNRESIETNPLYVSRKDVENSVLVSRKNSDFPIGNVEIKGIYVKLEEFNFYEEIKNEYIFAKGDSVKLAELDKKLAELIILSSPKGVAIEQRYQIQLTEEEIVAGGLVVSQEFLTKYGLAVDYFEYTNTIIEREYKEKLEIIQNIETEITELTTIITELTRKITIEESSNESIILEISKKREKVRILKEKLYALLISLRKSGNGGNEKPDEDLLALKDLEKRLMDELDRLKKQKEHQDEVNNRIKELKEKISKLKENDTENQLQSKQKKLEEMLGYIEELKKQKREKESRFDSDKVTDIEKITLKEEIVNLEKKIKKYEENASKLQNEINKLKKGLDGNGTEKLRNQLKDLEKQREYTQGVIDDFERDEYENGNRPVGLEAMRVQLKQIEEKIKEIKEQLEELDDQSTPSDEIAKLESELTALLKEQEGFDKNIDEKITNKEKELADVREKIKNKETKKVGLGEFEVGADGDLFAGYCRDNGITREDGTEIKSGADIDTSAVYLKDGKRLKLEFRRGGAFGDDDNARTTYEFVYEQEESTGTDDIEKQLLIIIREQEELEAELEALEIKLKKEKSESIRITIEDEIKRIQQKLVVIKQSIVDITNCTSTYKETITQHRYGVYKVREIPVPDWKESFEMTAVLSDMGTDVFREKAALRSEEYLKAHYKSLGRWQIGSRLALFLGRGHKRQKIINTYMKNMSKNPFQRDAGFAALNEQSQNAADRHEHELNTGMETINKITTIHNDEIDKICKEYLSNAINDDEFQDKFNKIISDSNTEDDISHKKIQEILNGEDIKYTGTNILLKLQEQKALNKLISDMNTQLSQYMISKNPTYMDNMRNYISQYIKDYQKTPAFMSMFEKVSQGNVAEEMKLRNYFMKHQGAVMQMQLTNLRMNIDILNKGKSAYQIDNKDRETGKGSWKYKLGHFMDKHPRGTALGTTAILVGSGLLTGLIGSAAIAGGVSLGVCGAVVGTTNAVKKWTHHTKEQNTHEKNMVTDYRNEQAKIQAWQNQALNGHGRKKYKAKRQLALYDQTTQENIKLSDQITEYITNLSSKVGPLTADENNFMRCNLIEGWARLKYYRQMGHNFLASEQVDKTEKDMKRLEKAITLGLQKIGKTTNDIETNMTATNDQNTNITYDVIQKDLKASYDKSLIQFKRERRNLSLKYGFGTAIASIGVGAFFQWITHSGMWAGKDIAPTPGTPGTPETTTSYTGGTDNFALGGDNLANGNVYNSTKSAITGSGAPTGSEVTFNYSVGTDGTKAISTFASGPKEAALNADFANSALYPNLSGAQVKALQDEAAKIITDPSFVTSTPSFETAELARLRALEDLEHFARGINDSARPDLVLKFNHTGSVPGTTRFSLPERFMTGSIDITTPEIPPIPGDPGKEAVRRGRWFMGMPLFFNTFKDRKGTRDTTDQNRGKRRPQQDQSKANQNQPQVNPDQPKHS